MLTNRLIKFPQDTLYVLKYDKLMNDKDFQQLVLSGIKTELPYSGSDEERNTIYQYLESITTDKEYGQIASDILGEQADNKEKPNRQIEFQPEESRTSEQCYFNRTSARVENSKERTNATC